MGMTKPPTIPVKDRAWMIIKDRYTLPRDVFDAIYAAGAAAAVAGEDLTWSDLDHTISQTLRARQRVIV